MRYWRSNSGEQRRVHQKSCGRRECSLQAEVVTAVEALFYQCYHYLWKRINDYNVSYIKGTLMIESGKRVYLPGSS